jgi:uncharacterized protein with HEPN domain
VESCTAIQAAAQNLTLEGYRTNRLVRSSIEREFILIGEAIAALARVAPDVFESITKARRIVDFRNQLTHEYATVDDTVVWAITETDVPVLARESATLLRQLDSSSP